MKIPMRLLLILLALCSSILAQAPQPPAPQSGSQQRKLPTVYKVQGGDLNGDGKAEVIAWDSETRELTVMDYSSNRPKKITSHLLEQFPALIKVADLDGDRKGELIVGEGLRGYNPKTGPQTDIRLRIYRPLEKDGWNPIEIFRQASERPEGTSLQVIDLDGDKQPEILFAYFAEKYQVDIRIARRVGDSWQIQNLPRVRMGAHVAAGDVLHNKKKMVVVGRPYGEDTTAIGGAFVQDGENRIELPTFRGVSSVALGDVDGDGRTEIVVGDGWHYDYGKVARPRLAVIKYVNGKWDYKLIEDVPEQIRIRNIALVDLDRDGRAEIIAHGERRNSLGGDVRVYQLTPAGWRGMTAAKDVQGFAVGNFTGGRKTELIFSGTEPQLLALDLRRAKWDAQLAEAVETYKVDPNTLIGKLAPRLQAEEWIGGEPLTIERLKGKVVLLDFWATWCKPCIAAFPKMREWHSKYGPRGLVIIGVTNHSSQTSEQVRSLVKKENLPWIVAIDPNDRTQMYYGVSPIPHTFLIDRTGVVRLSHIGGGNLQEVEKQIELLLTQD